jgi:FKBP-type peptidyl-prolyl cis-trans isomerase
MTKIRDRAFAWVGIVVFTVSALALTAAVIIQQVMSNSNSASTTAQTSCTDNAKEQTLTAPSAYVPKTAVTSLQSIDLTPGTGQTAQSGDCLIVKYYGTLASNGTEFDQDFTDASGFAFTLGAGQVIKGWDQGLVGMKVGGTRILVIPPSLAYGSQASGTIPANAALVFVVKLLRIQS